MGALKCTSSDPESPALAATTSTLGSPPAPGRRRCTHTTEAVVPPSRALPPRPPPPLDAGMQASRDGKHDPALAYERSTRSNALTHADSSSASGASAPHRSSSSNTARSQWDDAVAFTCPSNTAKHDRKSPDLAASKSSASSSSAAPDAPAARAPRLALARLALGGRSPVSQNTSGTATNLSSPFRAYIWTAYEMAPARVSPSPIANPPGTAAIARSGHARATDVTARFSDSREKAKSRAKGPREFARRKEIQRMSVCLWLWKARQTKSRE